MVSEVGGGAGHEDNGGDEEEAEARPIVTLDDRWMEKEEEEFGGGERVEDASASARVHPGVIASSDVSAPDMEAMLPAKVLFPSSSLIGRRFEHAVLS